MENKLVTDKHRTPYNTNVNFWFTLCKLKYTYVMS